VSRNFTLLLLNVSNAKLITSPKHTVGRFLAPTASVAGEHHIANQMLNGCETGRNILSNPPATDKTCSINPADGYG
jgi:hypothetical protein